MLCNKVFTIITLIKNKIVLPHIICNDAAVEHELRAQFGVQYCRFYKFPWYCDHTVLENETMKTTISLWKVQLKIMFCKAVLFNN